MDGCISPPIPTENLEHFFLRNLEQDLITLSSSLGRSIDDAVLIIHLILKQLSQLPDIDFPGNLIIFIACNDLCVFKVILVSGLIVKKDRSGKMISVKL